jgi:calcium-dependent protein kinase
LKELLRLNPDKRPSAAIALKHDWFKKNKIESYLNMRFIYECFNNFLKFSPELKFQQATLAYMVHHLLGNNDVKDIKILFQMFDSDNDGRLSHEELVEGFREHLSFLPNEKEFHKLIKKADQDKSGYIDYEGKIS